MAIAFTPATIPTTSASMNAHQLAPSAAALTPPTSAPTLASVAYTTICHLPTTGHVRTRLTSAVNALCDTYLAVTHPTAAHRDVWDTYLAISAPHSPMRTRAFQLMLHAYAADPSREQPTGSDLLLEELDMEYRSWLSRDVSPDGSEVAISGQFEITLSVLDERQRRARVASLAAICDALTSALTVGGPTWGTQVEQVCLFHLSHEGQPLPAYA